MVRLDDAQFEALFFLDSHFSEGVAWFFSAVSFRLNRPDEGNRGKTGGKKQSKKKKDEEVS